ncbi:unnamed protein product [Rhizoctonia solani]|uniref:Uncharacterized protein n=1 Tax=Rhizoctonia solani TaxID=456999 RepID=A0A8H2WDA9_9AGAM|nr:unnamed protein product [Rhizoctonia solani]
MSSSPSPPPLPFAPAPTRVKFHLEDTLISPILSPLSSAYNSDSEPSNGITAVSHTSLNVADKYAVVSRLAARVDSLDDAPGTLPDEYYDAAMAPWRAAIRRRLVKNLKHESEWIGRMQRKIRRPFLDTYFVYTSSLGTHTFFMIVLPTFFFFGYPMVGFGLLYVLAAGVYFSSLIKDLICSPRPFEPTVTRLTVGTHHFTDCAAGIAVGTAIWAAHLQWGSAFDVWVTSNSWSVPIIILVFGLFLVHRHAEPVDDCPCFEDAIAFVSVVMGAVIAHWHFSQLILAPSQLSTWSDYFISRTPGSNLATPYDIATFALYAALKMVVGITAIFVWRIIAKRVLLTILPPIYRKFSSEVGPLPTRRWYTPATDYAEVPADAAHLRSVPSVIDLPSKTSVVTSGVLPRAHIYRKFEAESKQRNGKSSLEKPGMQMVECEIAPANGLVREEKVKHYDADVLTKVGVYMGIGAIVGKSSATSATRKKHARKAVTHDPSIAIVPAAKSQGKGKGKGKNKEPRVKQYIPPPKYKPIVDDPIESLAIASALPPNMVLCFKGLSKKDPVTKMKALDELATMLNDESWSIALPVWFWHFVPLTVHPNRRLRESNATIHSKLFEQPGLRDEAQSYVLREPNAGILLAAWVLGANDIIPTIANTLKASWDSNIASHTTSPENQLVNIQDHVEHLVSTLTQAITYPEQLYRQFAPLLAISAKDDIDATDTGEHPRDRDGRIRTMGINSVTWIIEEPSIIVHAALVKPLRELLSSNPLLGTVLSSQLLEAGFSDKDEAQNDGVPWGYEQRTVRMAGWKLITALVKYLQSDRSDSVEEDIDDNALLPLKLGFLRNLGCAALRSAWMEKDSAVRSSMWEGFLPLITAFPEVWSIEPIDQASIGTSGHAAAESDSDEDIEDGTMETVPNRTTYSPTTTNHGRLAFADFLHFLQLGCQGSAIQSYPAIVVVLSTIPETIFPYEHSALERLFASFWAAYDGKALNVLPRDRESTWKAFLSSVLDCVIFLSRKLHTSTQLSRFEHISAQPGHTLELVPLGWIAHIIQEIIYGDLSQNISVDAAGQLIGGSMKKLENISSDMTRLAWRVAWEPALFRPSPSPDQSRNTIKLLANMRSASHGGINQEIIDKILKEKVQVEHGQAEDFDLPAEQAQILIGLWTYLDSVTAPWLAEVTGQVWNTEILDRMVRSRETQGIISFLNGYLNASNVTEISRRAIWTQFLNACTGAGAVAVLRSVLDSVETSAPKPDEASPLFDLSKSWMADITRGEAAHSTNLGSIVVHWKICLSQTQTLEILDILLSSFVVHARELLFNSSGTISSVIEPLAQVLAIVLASDTSPDFYGWPVLDFVEASAFLFILATLPATVAPFPRFVQCDKALKSWSTHTPVELQSAAGARAKELIRSILFSCSTPLSARDILAVALRSALYPDEKMILLEMIPPQHDLDRDLDDLNDNPSPVLAEYDPLIRLSDREPDSVALATYDSYGFSKYARVGTALATILSENRHLARDNLWAFRHLLALQQLCSDFVSAATWPSEVFKAGTSDQVYSLLDIIAPLVIYLGNSLLADHSLEWHRETILKLQKPSSDTVTPQNAEDVVHWYYSIVTHNSPVSRDLRLLRRIMQFVLRDVETDILDLWSGFAQSAYNHYPQAAEAIGSVLAARGVESPRLDRWRNDIASRIPGVSSDSINQTGLPLLRALNSLAPPPESGIVFMPQQRAVYLVQALQKWMSSDDEIDTSMEALLTVLLRHLLPILQTVRGAHWEFILDILETNLSVETNTTNLYLLLQTLRAITVILDLASTNQQLKEIWIPRQHDIFQGALHLFLTSGGDTEHSETHIRYNSCLAEVIQALPSEQIQSDLFEKLLSLTSSESIPVKVTAHYLARKALAQITEQRVLEAAVTVPSESLEETDIVADNKFELPQTLVGKLVAPVSGETDWSNVNLLLTWWLALEFFDNTSLKVKQDYVEQLRKLDLVKTSLLPCLFKLLNLGVAGEKPFNLSPWQVDNFYLSLYDKSFSPAESVLAAHIYFKSLKFIPALIRTWYSECQDRQLSASISAYTRAHFSPALINDELAQFRVSAASASEALADDTFTLRVAPSVNEISASYAVDEQEAFEVAIRLPSEYPLRAAEVKDVRGVAGMENRRRAWLFGMQNMAQVEPFLSGPFRADVEMTSSRV